MKTEMYFRVGHLPRSLGQTSLGTRTWTELLSPWDNKYKARTKRPKAIPARCFNTKAEVA